DMGMAKMAGRAIRTFVRLAKKLEAAEQHGDEVKVPGWTDADDRALAEGIVDILGPAHYFKEQGFTGRTEPFESASPLQGICSLPDAIRIHDPDVHAGAMVQVYGAVVRYLDRRSANKVSTHSESGFDAAQRKSLMESAREMLDDPAPGSRCLGVYLLGSFGQGGTAAIAAAQDPAVEVRFVAALTLADRAEEMAALESLRNDSSGAVRAAAWIIWLEHKQRTQPDRALKELIGFVRTEKNPIIKAIVAFYLSPVMRRDGPVPASSFDRAADRLSAIRQAVPRLNDPWLKAAGDAFLPLFPWRQKLTDTRDGASSRRRTKAVAGIVKLMRSPKRSHKVLGTCSLLAHFRYRSNRAKSDGLDLQAIEKLADSNDPWERTVGLLLIGVGNKPQLLSWLTGRPQKEEELDRPKAVIRLVRALKSDDELERLAALAGINISQKRVVARQLQETVVAAFRKPPFAVSAAAAAVIGHRFPFENALSVFQDEVDRDPKSIRSRLLLEMLAWTRHWDGRAVWKQQRRKVMDVVLKTNDLALQNLFVERMRNYWLLDKDPLNAVVRGLEPMLFRKLLLSTDIMVSVRLDGAAGAVADRLDQVLDPGKPVSAEMVTALTAYVNKPSHLAWKSNAPLRARWLTILADALAACSRNGASKEETAAGFLLLEAIVGSYGPLLHSQPGDLPPPLSKAIVQLLGHAGDEALFPEAARALGALYCYLGARKKVDAPGLLEAMEPARSRIMESGRPSDQVILFAGVVKGRDRDLGARAWAELQKRLLAGTMPQEQRLNVVKVAAFDSRMMSQKFIDHLLETLIDPNQPMEYRKLSARALSRRPDQVSALLDAVAECAKTNQPIDEITRFADSAVRAALRQTQKHEGPPPVWRNVAAETGLMLARDAKRTAEARSEGLKLYAHATGMEAVVPLEEIMLDEKEDPALRLTAVLLVEDVCPVAAVYAVLAENYGKLPIDMRKALATKPRYKKPLGDGAFTVCALKDKELASSRWLILARMRSDPTPELVAVVKELQTDENAHVRMQARSKLEQWEKNAKKSDQAK
ncbi:MAG: hypothetical protein HQ592_18905, partial [Planctomycetes bacterium]|nr:hypothetical protein [Planctomycetota bacterium]